MKNVLRKIAEALVALGLGCAGVLAQGSNPVPQETPPKVDCKKLGLTDNLNEVNEARDTITVERTVLQQQTLRLKDEIQAATSSGAPRPSAPSSNSENFGTRGARRSPSLSAT